MKSSPGELRRAVDLIISDPEIMGGDPVFVGTRVPVHAIAAQLEQGDSEADVLEGYPRLTVEMIRLAPVYAAAHPIEDRSRKQPWQARPPISVTREKLPVIDED
jgi:uncharacterized protein (DUF433 family)